LKFFATRASERATTAAAAAAKLTAAFKTFCPNKGSASFSRIYYNNEFYRGSRAAAGHF
jgi:hypothetical protein